jgi:hypothetical protein
MSRRNGARAEGMGPGLRSADSRSVKKPSREPLVQVCKFCVSGVRVRSPVGCQFLFRSAVETRAGVRGQVRCRLQRAHQSPTAPTNNAPAEIARSATTPAATSPSRSSPKAMSARLTRRFRIMLRGPTDPRLSGAARDANGNALAMPQRSGPCPLQALVGRLATARAVSHRSTGRVSPSTGIQGTPSPPGNRCLPRVDTRLFDRS